MSLVYYHNSEREQQQEQQQQQRQLEEGRLLLWLSTGTMIATTFAAFCILQQGSFLSFVQHPLFLPRAVAKMLTTFCFEALFTPLHLDCWPFQRGLLLPGCFFSQDIFVSPWKGPKYLRFFTSFCAIIQISILHCVINKTPECQGDFRVLSNGEWEGREGQLLCCCAPFLFLLLLTRDS